MDLCIMTISIIRPNNYRIVSAFQKILLLVYLK